MFWNFIAENWHSVAGGFWTLGVVLVLGAMVNPPNNKLEVGRLMGGFALICAGFIVAFV